MTSRTTARFRSMLAALPAEVRQQARRAYRLFSQDPQHPGLRFRQVHLNPPLYSARIGIHYRPGGGGAGWGSNGLVLDWSARRLRSLADAVLGECCFWGMLVKPLL